MTGLVKSGRGMVAEIEAKGSKSSSLVRGLLSVRETMLTEVVACPKCFYLWLYAYSFDIRGLTTFERPS